MAAYRNDYTQTEDLALWMLHEIRQKTVRRTLRPDTINRSARELIRKRGLTNLRLLRKGDVGL